VLALLVLGKVKVTGPKIVKRSFEFVQHRSDPTAKVREMEERF